MIHTYSKYLRIHFFLLSVVLAFFNAKAQEVKFNIKGEVKGLKNGSITVMYTGPGYDLHQPDTVQIKNSKFHYKGKIDQSKLVFMLFNGLEDGKVKSYGFPIFLDNSMVTVRADLKDLTSAQIKGSKVNDSYLALQNNTSLFKVLQKKEYEIRIAGDKQDTVRLQQAIKEREKCVEDIVTYLSNTEGYQDDLASAYLIYDKVGRYMKGDQLLSVLDKYNNTINQSVYFSFLRREVYMEKRLALGQPAPDFTLSDIKGNAYQLKDFKGELVLLDFGASWCHWCKKEKPYLLEAYRQYNGKGLKIINISMDKKLEDWKEDLEKENYPWLSLSDLKAWSGDVAKDYNIKGIPNIMLIDQSGTIVGKSLRGNEIINAIDQHILPGSNENKGFEIRGRIKGLKDGQVFLVSNDQKPYVTIDSAVIKNEEFILKGKTDEVRVYQLQVPQRYFEGLHSYAPAASIFVENSDITFEARLDSLDAAIVRGSRIHDEYAHLLNSLPPLREIKTLEQKANLAYKKQLHDSVAFYFQQRDIALYKHYPEFLLENVAHYKNNKAYAYLFYKELGLRDWKIREAAIEKFDQKLNSYFYIKKIKADIAKYKAISVGTQAPNFTLPDVNGKSISLSDFKGKYVLIDFWASWCGPCRHETPNIKAAYEKYKNKGLEVIAISLDKKSQEKEWRKAIIDDGADWIQLSSLNGWNCSSAIDYHVKAIPHCVLIDKSGKIIAKNLRGKDFERELSKLLL